MPLLFVLPRRATEKGEKQAAEIEIAMRSTRRGFRHPARKIRRIAEAECEPPHIWYVARPM